MLKVVNSSSSSSEFGKSSETESRLGHLEYKPLSSAEVEERAESYLEESQEGSDGVLYGASTKFDLGEVAMVSLPPVERGEESELLVGVVAGVQSFTIKSPYGSEKKGFVLTVSTPLGMQSVWEESVRTALQVTVDMRLTKKGYLEASTLGFPDQIRAAVAQYAAFQEGREVFHRFLDRVEEAFYDLPGAVQNNLRENVVTTLQAIHKDRFPQLGFDQFLRLMMRKYTPSIGVEDSGVRDFDAILVSEADTAKAVKDALDGKVEFLKRLLGLSQG